MSVSITFNGGTYVIPVTGDESWGANVSAYLVAIAQGSLQKTGGNFTLSAETNFGPTYGLLSAYFKTRAALPATTGVLRLSKTDTLAWRNNANSSNLTLGIDGSDNLIFNGSTFVAGAISALTGDVTATGPGSAVASIASTVVTGKVLTGYVSGAGTISATDTILEAIQKLNGNIGALTTGVSSVFGRTGTVTAQAGDYAVADVTGAAPLASPIFSGSPQVGGTSTTQARAFGDFVVAGASSNTVIGIVGYNVIPAYRGYFSRGTEATPFAVNQDDRLLDIGGRGYDGTAFTTTSSSLISFVASENWTSSARGAEIRFLTTPNTTTTQQLALTIANSGALNLPLLTASTALALDSSKNIVSVTNTGTGNNVLATSPTLVTPILGVATATSINKVAFTSPATGSTLTLADGKTFTVSNTLTLAGTDGSTLNIGAGGTLGSNAYTSTAYAPLASPTFTGTVTIPTPFTLGATSVTSTGTQLNYLNAATGTTGTTSTNLVFSASPTFTGTLNAGALTNTGALTSYGTITQRGTGTAAIGGSLNVFGNILNVGPNYTYTFTVSGAAATAGATYTNNGQTFTVVTTIVSGITTLRCTGTGAPTASGTLTYASGTGDATISFSATSTSSGLGGNVRFFNDAAVSHWYIGLLGSAAATDLVIRDTPNSANRITLSASTGVTAFSLTTDSTSSTTGAVTLAGGLGVAKAIVSGGTIRAGSQTTNGLVRYAGVSNNTSIANNANADFVISSANRAGCFTIEDTNSGESAFVYFYFSNTAVILAQSSGNKFAIGTSAGKINLTFTSSTGTMNVLNNGTGGSVTIAVVVVSNGT